MATVLAHSTSATALLVSSDPAFRQGIRTELAALRWLVKEASGGAEALAQLENGTIGAVILDSWLPDLTIEEFVQEMETAHAGVDLISADGSAMESGAKVPRRGELLFALRRFESGAAVGAEGAGTTGAGRILVPTQKTSPGPKMAEVTRSASALSAVKQSSSIIRAATTTAGHDLGPLPEFVGSHPAMLEVSRRIRLVAPRKTSVLVQGPTGSGKELVARAIHRLSPRAQKPFVALNCAAIPEALLEAELFGHSRGAFTGAVQRRTGRIEAAEGGTLFLDEIGEMPLALQSKLLRFLESGELQRVGENDCVHVDVRIIAATHQPLALRAKEGSFRADLFYRLAVFFVTTPGLREHGEDVRALARHFLARLGSMSPVKRLTEDALHTLEGYEWPGNVRELEHVIERAYILAEDRCEIGPAEIEFGSAL